MKGNRERLLAEWRKLYDLQDKSTKNINPSIQKQEGVSGANPEYIKKRDEIWSEGAEKLHPLADELDKQEALDRQNQMARFIALKKLLKGE